MSTDRPRGQLPLALRFPPDQRFETFAGNAAAVAQLRALASGSDRQSRLLVGAAGSGRSHLAIATCAAAGEAGIDAAYLPVATALPRLGEALQALDRHPLVALDDVDAAAGDPAAEVALFDFHNRMADAGHALLYTAAGAPDAWPPGLPDLRSRVAQCTRVPLAPLDDAGRRELLRLRATRRGLAIDDVALDWLLQRAGRDAAGLAALFDRLDRAALAAQRRLTIPFLREALPELAGAATR